MIKEFTKQIIRQWPYAVVFLCTIVFLLAIKYPYSAFTDSRDPYYHTRQAISYATQTEISYPALTYFSEYPADPWYGYHKILALSYFGADNLSRDLIIKRTILLHSILSALLMVAIAYLGVRYYRTIFPVYERQFLSKKIPFRVKMFSDKKIIFIVTSTMTLLSSGFVFRALLMERPHTLMITLVMIGLLCMVSRNYVWLLIMAIIAPLVYSLSLFIFIPVVMMLVGWLVVDRSSEGFRLIRTPFLYTTGGYALGLFAHPDTAGYLLNGVAFHFFAVFQSLLWWIPNSFGELPIPTEMLFSDTAIRILFLPIIVSLGTTWYRLRESATRVEVVDLQVKWVTMLEAGFNATALLLGVVSLFIYRTIEYAVPLLFIAFITVLFGLLIPLAQYLHQSLWNYPGEIASFYQQTVYSIKKFSGRKTITAISLVGILYVAIFIVMAREQATKVNYAPDRLEEAVSFLADQSGVGLIMTSDFAMYTQAIFYGPTNHYAIGMDPRMTYFYNRETSRQLYLFLGNEKDCLDGCKNQTEAETRSFLQLQGVTHLVIDEDSMSKNRATYIKEQSFLELLYQSKEYPDVQVYKLK
ncbi:hypothetical protein GW766_03480 [Candidatus Parcubacteria bacterium]|nr:hypothetical protein [Candidatus Parcubacteria bacterium]